LRGSCSGGGAFEDVLDETRFERRSPGFMFLLFLLAVQV
jgi:hypothetical protein